ncbi:MAG TPA: LytTR family DNA-binding domain-containing protein [Holophaga sp.]|jgi:two-component system LytT family response regulator|nr:LytTR family DNA-binding domain-containing protein [Holophaga sp.]
MALKYALIEDEPPARRLLQRMIQELRPDAVCLAEASDGEAGLHLLAMTQPDVIFMDIEFPPAGAFGLLQAARDKGLVLPPIVFVTAYDRHAVEAFRWSARDYLLKPVEREQLRESLMRIEAQSAPAPELEGLLSALQAVRRSEIPERFTVLHKGRMKVFTWDEVSHLVTENRMLFVVTPEGRFVLDRTLDELEKLLAPRFFRCHRGAMVDLNRVREVVTEPGGTGELRLESNDRVNVSRDRMAELRRRLGA